MLAKPRGQDDDGTDDDVQDARVEPQEPQTTGQTAVNDEATDTSNPHANGAGTTMPDEKGEWASGIKDPSSNDDGGDEDVRHAYVVPDTTQPVPYHIPPPPNERSPPPSTPLEGENGQKSSGHRDKTATYLEDPRDESPTTSPRRTPSDDMSNGEGRGEAVGGDDEAFCPKFLWRDAEFVVRDISWVDLSKHTEQHEPYFYKECFQTNSRKNSKVSVFKSKQFSLYVVVPEAQWHEYEDFLEKTQDDGTPVARVTSTTQQSSRPPASHFQVPLYSGSTSSGSARPLEMARTRARTLFTSNSVGRFTSPDDGETGLRLSTTPEPGPSNSALRMTVQLSKKRGHQKSDSVSSVVARSPPMKKGSGVVAGSTPVKLKGPQAGITIIDLCSPDRDHLKEALKAGGSTDLDVTKILKVKI
ncbi:hypothetical protein PAXINDRAFT_19392 [Paxillus involutus ATCC 200175]|uniref:Uncharacterized protein n=1 Tax=Paxillus involutus ATCC 200175 TaxID=664439 RepID=A0A0C9TJ99_PAXIN|nr:hypothetical protein PAXINDRAFT_19392 [Paxillus involutus ATCC 200175]